MVKVLAKAGDACEQTGRQVAGAHRFLRTGQSAALQDNRQQARAWLERAARLAEAGGDAALAREARLQLTENQEVRPGSPAGLLPGIQGAR